MSVLKCKMCGGDLEVIQGMSVCECIYCGSKQTLPKMGSERKNNLYDRASHFRRNNEYDKAMAIYEQILYEESDDAETYWSILLCRYGIEYVEDPTTHRRIPTVNRAQMTSVFLDEDYKSAIKYADEEQRKVYEAEAEEIDRIQKGILAISSKEEPFDVFICYKESDANGRRTEDSVLANDLYHQLTQEGFRVFFARITLEDKLGSAYEPYIFAALNSAKVMIVLGTKPEYFNAVWVKNEWSRYLSMIKGGARKILIPAYKNMDPYDLPDEFSHLQAQDMSKLGFMQDLIRGIKKLTGTAEENNYRGSQSAPQSAQGSNTEAFLKRGFMALEDTDFSHADGFFEQVLNQDPENAMAYVGKLMADKQVQNREDLSKGTEELTGYTYFQRALQFADNELKKELEKYNSTIIDRNETNRKDAIYDKVVQKMEESEHQINPVETVKKMEEALNNIQAIEGWKDVDQKEQEIRNRLINAQKIADNWEKEQKKRKGKMKLIMAIAVATGLIVIIIYTINAQIKIDREHNYETALSYMNEGEYEKAIELFEKLKGYEDSEVYLMDCQNELNYRQAIAYMDAEEYEKAIELFKDLNDYEDSEVYLTNCQNEANYRLAETYMEGEEYEKAIELFTELQDYQNSKNNLEICRYNQALAYIESENYEQALELLRNVSDYKNSAELLSKCLFEANYKEALDYIENKEFSKAESKITILYNMETYKEAEKMRELQEKIALGYLEAGDYYHALENIGFWAKSEDYAERYEPERDLLKNAQIGDSVIYGYDHLHYKIDDRLNGILKWKIIDICDNKALLLAEFRIGIESFDGYYDDGDIVGDYVKNRNEWEESCFRMYLNNDFLDGCFTSEEKNTILQTTVNNTGIPENELNGIDIPSYEEYIEYTGNDTQDKVFLLSFQEVLDYSVYDDFESDGILTRTNAVWNHWDSSISEGEQLSDIIYLNISRFGETSFEDYRYGCNNNIRPAMWVSLD